MKVYVIEKGAYSDRHIVGVCLDKKKADEIAKAISVNIYNQAYVTEYDTDQFIISPLRWTVGYYTHKWSAEYDDYNLHTQYTESTALNRHNFIVYADTKEQAIKIAQDLRAEYLAKKKGIT